VLIKECDDLMILFYDKNLEAFNLQNGIINMIKIFPYLQ